jgi:hypothetical protein
VPERMIQNLRENVKMITGKTMAFEKRKVLIDKYLVRHYMERFYEKMREEDVAEFLKFERELCDSKYSKAKQIREIARKRARTLDEKMTEKITIEEEYSVITEFVRASI